MPTPKTDAQPSAAVSNWLRLDADAEVKRIADWISGATFKSLKRRGVVVAVSGGIDSSVCVALCATALGPQRVLALLMPEADSAAETTRLGNLVASRFGIRTIVEDITSVLTASGCYRRRDDAIRQVIPEYGPGWKSKIVLPPATEKANYNVFSIVAESPDGRKNRTRLTADAYLAIVAATNFKQRVRKMMEYHYADLLRYAVVGTPNRLEYDQGFFVKLGDGAADLKPIAHLYKTQVYQLAEHLGVPEEVRRRPPTTDTYPLAQSQEEFYFALPYDKMDICLYGMNNGVPAAEIGGAVGLPTDAVEHVFRDIVSKRRVAEYLHCPPLLPSESSTASPGAV